MPILSLQWSGSFNPTGVSFSAASVHQFLYFRWLCQFKWFFNEQTLLRFCSHLADHFHHCSIKVYLSAIRSLHIDQGYPIPWWTASNFSALSGALSATKAQLSHNASQWHPTMRIIQHPLDTHNSEHVMLWAACCLGFFGFLRAGEFMVNSTFDPSIHLTVQDLQVDDEVNPSSFCMCIESSRNDLFLQGCFIYLGRALSNFGHPGIFTSLRALIWSPVGDHGRPLTCSRLSSFIQSVLQGAGIPGSFQATVFALGPLRHLRNAAFQITLSRPWAGGPVMHINSTLESLWNQFWNQF